MLLGGGAVGAYLYSHQVEQLNDSAFLQSRLKAIGQDTGPAKGGGRRPALVRVAEAKWETISSIRSVPGRLYAVREATLSSEVSGLIRSIPIEPGTKLVGEQTLLAQIDRTWLELMLRQNEAEIGSLKADMEHQQAELDRIEPLVVSRAVSISDLSLQKSKVDKLQQDLVRLEVVRSEIREKWKRTTILAPFDGYVIERVADLGELVSPGSPIAKIVSHGNIDAKIHVGEQIIDRIKVGDVYPILIGELGLQLEGKIHEIVPFAQTAARAYPVIMRLDDDGGRLKPGMTIETLITTTDPIEGIVVPKDAVLVKPDGSTVWVLEDLPDEKRPDGEPTENLKPRGIAKPVFVSIVAHAVDDYSVVPQTPLGRDILKPGVKVVIEGGERLTADQLVQVETVNPALFDGLPDKTGQQRLR